MDGVRVTASSSRCRLPVVVCGSMTTAPPRVLDGGAIHYGMGYLSPCKLSVHIKVPLLRSLDIVPVFNAAQRRMARRTDDAN